MPLYLSYHLTLLALQVALAEMQLCKLMALAPCSTSSQLAAAHLFLVPFFL